MFIVVSVCSQIFLPGQKEISYVCKRLRETYGPKARTASLLLLALGCIQPFEIYFGPMHHAVAFFTTMLSRSTTGNRSGVPVLVLIVAAFSKQRRREMTVSIPILTTQKTQTAQKTQTTQRTQTLSRMMIVVTPTRKRTKKKRMGMGKMSLGRSKTRTKT